MQTSSKSMARHFLAVIMCLLLMLATLQTTVWAVDLEGPNSLTVTMGMTMIAEYGDEVEKADIVIDLYKLADAAAVPDADTYGYAFTGQFGGLTDVDLTSGSVSLTSDQWMQLAQNAAVLIRDTGMTPDAASQPLGSAIGQLGAGLYLVIARGEGVADYWQTEKDGSIVTTARSGDHVFSFTPSVISLPSKAALTDETDANGMQEIRTDESYGDWLYDVTAELKASVEQGYGGITIEKTIDGYSGDEEVTFVFQVDASFPEKENDDYHYSNVVAIAFDASTGSTNTAVVDHIRAGATVTVTEIYTGLKYTEGTIIAPASTTVVAGTNSEIVFRADNHFHDEITGGHGIQNHYTYSDTTADVPWLIDQEALHLNR